MDDAIKSDDGVKIETTTKKDEKSEDQTDKKLETKPEKKPNSKGKKKWLMVALAVIFIGTAGGGTWLYMNKKAKEDNKKDQEQIASLEKQVSEKDAEIAKAKSDLEAAKKSGENASTSSAPSAATLANIQAAVESKNYAALEGYMNSSVTVIIAASECCGARTPTQAINDMKYLNNATLPWNFALPVATLAQYRAGDYKQYFPTDALVGRSANSYVVSFSFSLGKISTVFMSVNEDIL